MSAPRVTLRPVSAEFVDYVARRLNEDIPHRHWTRTSALAWILDDFTFHPVHVPAFGRMSPVLAGFVRDWMTRGARPEGGEQ